MYPLCLQKRWRFWKLALLKKISLCMQNYYKQPRVFSQFSSYFIASCPIACFLCFGQFWSNTHLSCIGATNVASTLVRGRKLKMECGRFQRSVVDTTVHFTCNISIARLPTGRLTVLWNPKNYVIFGKDVFFNYFK